MKCDCMKDMEVRLAEHFKGVAGEGTTATCKARAICFGKEVTEDLKIDFTIRGPNRKFKTIKGYDTFVVANYCPFCGKQARGKPTEGDKDDHTRPG